MEVPDQGTLGGTQATSHAEAESCFSAEGPGGHANSEGSKTDRRKPGGESSIGSITTPDAVAHAVGDGVP
eukprot:9591888-Heterocapsa_arctica.AAC.1